MPVTQRGVRSTHADYDRFAPKWKRVRDVIAGQDAMHTAATAYLPKLKDEEPSDYDARRKRSDFFNGTWRTIDALSGMAFRKAPTVEVPAAIEPYLDDITLSSMPMESFAREVVEEVLGPGRYGILIDHPPASNVTPLTVDAAQRLGLRPTLQLYPAESIRNWKFERRNNAWTLTRVVLGESAEVEKDEFTVEVEERYRVLDLGGDGGTYRQRVFKVEKEKDVLIEEIVPLMNGAPLDFIPFMIGGAGGRGDQIDEPPLIDLVDKNIAHYQVNADYRHGLHFTGLPTPVVCGYQPEDNAPKLYIGSQAAWVFPDPQAKAEFLEFEGTGLQAIEKALDRLERQMAMLGARMIADEGKQAETLGATQIKRAGENSVLAKIVKGVSEALEWALGVFAYWAGAGGEITYQISREFLPAMMDAQTLNSLLAMRLANELSSEELFELLQRGDVIDGEKTHEEHKEQLDAEPMPMPKPALNDDGEDEVA